MSATFAELLRQPFFWIAVVFAVIAATYAVTQRNDVARNSTRASVAAQWYPVIHGESMPKSGRAIANGATMVEVVQGSFPIKCTETASETAFLSGVTLAHRTKTCLVYGCPAPTRLFCSFWVSLFPSSSFYTVAFWVSSLECAFPGPLLLKVSFAPSTAACSAAISMLFSPTLVVLGFCAGFAGGSIALDHARLTSSAKPWGIGSSIFVKILTSGWKAVTTHYAMLRWQFVHEAISYWSYLRRCGQAVGLAIQAVHEAALAHSLKYTTEGAFV